MSRRTGQEPARADLHLHSTHSDGLLAPSVVMEMAADAGLSVVALTDHDSLAGLPEARSAATARGLELIPGVEISTRDLRGGERHLLAYGIDPDHEPLRDELARNASSREDRVQAMVDALASVGVRISVEDVLAEAKGSIGRPHVADALVRKGHVRSRQEAFDRWLADGRVAHVAKANIDIAHAIQVVHDAGGVAVLAHPGRRWTPGLVEDLVRVGLDGVEVFHPSNSTAERTALQEMATRWGLLVTGGSDNHGDREGHAAMRAGRVPRELADRVVERVASRAATRDTARSGSPAALGAP